MHIVSMFIFAVPQFHVLLLNTVGATTNDTTSSPAVPGSKKLPPLPEIPKPVPKPRPREKKMYIAAYDYRPCEEGDLELIAVGDRDKKP